jgi:signal transduction histidine kinase
VLGLIALVVWLGTVVSRSVSRPLRRVTAAATAVANLAARELVRVTDVESDDHRPPRLTAVRVRSADELGELASAFNRVQATAALMMEQQVTTRRNVAVMFANIARRTGGLVARQLSQIEELERDEPDQRRLARLYRLDHLTARLRRSADSLLVVAGVRPDARIDAPMPLADVIRSAIGEVEGYRRVELGTVSNSVVTAAVVPDLILLLAELLENATAFSPPGTYVDISADVGGNGIVQIIDRGIGMLPQRLAEENLRLVTRERLDIAPTARLGLLVVGRLARRHGLRVRLQATVPTGVTVEVALPQNVFLRTLAHAITPEPAPAPDRPSPGTTVAQRTTSSPATTGSPYTTPLPGTAPLPGTIDSPGSTPSRDTAPLHGTVISQGPAVSRGRVRAQGAAAALNAALSQGAASLRDPALPPGAPVSQGPPLLHGAAPSRDASASLDASSSPGAASSRDAAATQSAASSRADAHARAIGGTSAGTTPSSSTDPLQADTASLVADALARTRGRRPGAPPQPHDPSRPDARAQPDAPSRTDAPARPHAPSQPNRRPATEGPSRGDRPSPTMGRPPADPLTRPDTHSRAEGASGNDGLPSAGSLSPIDPLTRSDASPGEDLRHPRTDRPSRSDGLSLMDSSVPADAPAAVDARTLASDASPTHASTPAGANGGQIAPLSRAGLRRRQPGQSLADLEVPQPNPGPAARDPAAERELFDSFVRGTARAAEEAATGQATAEESRGGLRQRRRGEHLDESLRGEPPRARGPWLSSSGPRQPPPVGPPSPTQPASPTPTIATVPPVPATEGAWPGSTASRPWAERPAAERAPRRPRVGPAGPAAGTGQPGPSSPVPGIGVAPGPGQRDAEAERSIYGGYLAGLARAKQASQAESDGYPHSDEQRSTS